MKKIFLLLFIYAFAYLTSCKNAQKAIEDIKHVDTNQPANKDTLNIVAVGDIMLGSTFPEGTHLPPDDALNSFDSVKNHLKGNIVFGNLEGTLLDEDASPKFTSKDVNRYLFKMPERYGTIIKNAGFNLLSIANNHIGDFKQKGARKTANVLDSLEIKYAGLLKHPYTIFETNGLKIAFCAFSPNSNTVHLLDLKNAKELIRKLKDSTDIVVVSFHGGGEGTQYEHVIRQNEFYISENRGNVYQFAHAAIDAGADLILGHGPHVTRAVELYKNKLIAYSLGNFCTYGTFNLGGPNGIAPILKIKLLKNGNFASAEVVSTKQDKIKRLQLDPSNRAYYKIEALTQIDFPETNLSFKFPNIFVKSNSN